MHSVDGHKHIAPQLLSHSTRLKKNISIESQLFNSFNLFKYIFYVCYSDLIFRSMELNLYCRRAWSVSFQFYFIEGKKNPKFKLLKYILNDPSSSSSSSYHYKSEQAMDLESMNHENNCNIDPVRTPVPKGLHCCFRLSTSIFPGCMLWSFSHNDIYFTFCDLFLNSLLPHSLNAWFLLVLYAKWVWGGCKKSLNWNCSTAHGTFTLYRSAQLSL